MLAHVLVLILLFAVPLWDVLEVRALRRSASPNARRDAYLRAIVVLWLLTAALLLLDDPLSLYFTPPASADGLFGHALPLVSLSPEFMFALLLGVLLGMLLPLLLIALHRPARVRLAAAFDSIDFLLPRDRVEYWLFAAVSVSAGVCEELLFRGFLIRYLSSGEWGLSLGAALILSSVAFGFAHVGQGWKQLLLTPIAGLMIGLLYLVSGSLWLAILVHVVIDLRALAFAMVRSAQRRAEAATAPG